MGRSFICRWVREIRKIRKIREFSVFFAGERNDKSAEKCGSRSCIAKADFRLAKPEKPQFTLRK